jgi:Predicted DNA alkylation repair enzyme
MTNEILVRLRADLRANADEKSIANYQRYFKETVKFYGLSMSAANKIAVKYWQEVKGLSKPEIFALCEDLFKSDYGEEAAVAATWAPKLTNQFVLSDLAVFKRWIDSYLNDWAKVDGFCNHTVGNFVQKYPASIMEIVAWSASSNRWLKRASAVSLIIPAKKGLFINEIFTISDRLLQDKDDMVQKGYGWMLKEAANLHQDEVYHYVLKHRHDMPRTALRYAIEKMPPDLKSEAMKRV